MVSRLFVQQTPRKPSLLPLPLKLPPASDQNLLFHVNHSLSLSLPWALACRIAALPNAFQWAEALGRR